MTGLQAEWEGYSVPSSRDAGTTGTSTTPCAAPPFPLRGGDFPVYPQAFW